MYQKKQFARKTYSKYVRLTTEQYDVLNSINKCTSKAIRKLIEDYKNNLN